MKWLYGALILAPVVCISSAAQADNAFYSAIYTKGSQQITLNAQEEPIPVPAIGSVIEIQDGATSISGRVASVGHQIARQSDGLVENRFFVLVIRVK